MMLFRPLLILLWDASIASSWILHPILTTTPTTYSRYSTTTPISSLSTRCYSYPPSTEFQTGQPFPYAMELFPAATTYNEMLSYIPARLNQLGYSPSTTLCATSLCGDEMNRPLEQALSDVFTQTYSLGGLAGFPLGGVTAFRKMKDHMPTDGSIFIVYGPHVGLSQDGRIGHVDRKGIRAVEGEHTLCCRSAILAANQVAQIHRGEAGGLELDPLDPSQYYVESYLMPFAERLEQSPDEASRMMDLPYALLEAQTELLERIIYE
eukprot:1569540-Ditylum_brightwellii.AAC.1